MSRVSYAREADRLAGGELAARPGPLDLTPVEGDWISATGLAGGIGWLRTRVRGDELAVHAGSHGEPRPGDWGEVRADCVFANAVRSTAGHAFLATFTDGTMTSQLQTYQGLGVVTGHTFHRFDDGRRSYFTREFYVPAGRNTYGNGAAGADASGNAATGDTNGDYPAVLLTGNNDPGALLGDWHGLASETTKSISRLTCHTDNDSFTVTAQGVGAEGPVDWPATSAGLYADAASPASPPAFLATFDHGYMRVLVQARINRGVLVVCEYTQFTDDSGRSDYFIRECYSR